MSIDFVQMLKEFKVITQEYLDKINDFITRCEQEELNKKGISFPTDHKGKMSQHFIRSEIACKCCGKIGPYPVNLKNLLDKLEKLRTLLDTPLIITCAYRCPNHNAEVGGVPNSYHCQGMAADLWAYGKTIDELATAAEQVGFGGIGRYYGQQFLHVDIGPQSRWTEY